MKFLIHAGLWFALVSGASAQTSSCPPLGLPPEFAAVRDLVAPRPEEELWKTIPWKTSLLEARALAAQQGKPIFLWSMDGHPLCAG
ncbi:MAG: hypothetical protein ACI9R3_001490 [Verrucomicrobiales bacterium]|jgi:hypothetical protein